MFRPAVLGWRDSGRNRGVNTIRWWRTRLPLPLHLNQTLSQQDDAAGREPYGPKRVTDL